MLSNIKVITTRESRQVTVTDHVVVNWAFIHYVVWNTPFGITHLAAKTVAFSKNNGMSTICMSNVHTWGIGTFAQGSFQGKDDIVPFLISVHH